MSLALVNLRTDPTVQAHLDELAEKCAEGVLSAEEQAEYEISVRAIDCLAVLQAQARSLLGTSCGA